MRSAAVRTLVDTVMFEHQIWRCRALTQSRIITTVHVRAIWCSWWQNVSLYDHCRQWRF